MFQAVNERTDERTEMFWSEDELLSYLKSVSHTERLPDGRLSVNSDFRDVFKDGRLAYYFTN